MKIKLNWTYAKGELDTDTLKLICLPARGKRLFGADELDAELCIKDGMNYQIAEIHLGDVETQTFFVKRSQDGLMSLRTGTSVKMIRKLCRKSEQIASFVWNIRI